MLIHLVWPLLALPSGLAVVSARVIPCVGHFVPAPSSFESASSLYDWSWMCVAFLPMACLLNCLGGYIVIARAFHLGCILTVHLLASRLCCRRMLFLFLPLVLALTAGGGGVLGH